MALADSWEAELLLGLRRLMDDGLIRRVVVVVVLNYGAFLFNQLIRRGTLDQSRLLQNYRGVSALKTHKGLRLHTFKGFVPLDTWLRYQPDFLFLVWRALIIIPFVVSDSSERTARSFTPSVHSLLETGEVRGH